MIDFALTDKWNYVFQSDVLQNDHIPEWPRSSPTTLSTSINSCSITSTTDGAVGGRAEWWKSNGDSIYALTAGVNFIPVPNFLIRPESAISGDPTDAEATLDPSSNRSRSSASTRFSRSDRREQNASNRIARAEASLATASVRLRFRSDHRENDPAKPQAWFSMLSAMTADGCGSTPQLPGPHRLRYARSA